MKDYDNDVTRCPWCHCTWSVIIASGWHSCEKPKFWDPTAVAARVAGAQIMREAAEKGMQTAAHAFGVSLAQEIAARPRIDRKRKRKE